MSDLTICSHCGKRRFCTTVHISAIINNNNKLALECPSCEELDHLEITPAKQEVNIMISPEVALADTIADTVLKGINEGFIPPLEYSPTMKTAIDYPLNSKWQDPDNGCIYEVLKHLESSIMFWNETMDMGSLQDMNELRKLVAYEG